MKKLNLEPSEPYATHIGPALALNGILRSSQPLDLHCVFHGSIEGTFIKISRNAKIEADLLRAQKVIIAGQFNGSMSVSEEIIILPGASVTSDIKVACLHIIEGAQFEGKIKMAGFSLDDKSQTEDRGH
ncbi:MAG: Polymer-forming cytoskeletal [Spirochaetes bacterium ADurb.Bin110]|nr:MAG: Polymer-forming cytoskeletal [Spirochaetes bacterium ADurb.Bin110]